MQDKKKRREKGFICHLCGREMSSGSKWYHLKAFHQVAIQVTSSTVTVTSVVNTQNTPLDGARETSMRNVWQGVHHQDHSEAAHDHPHRGQALRLRVLRQDLPKPRLLSR